MGTLPPPLSHPGEVAPDREYDRRHLRRIFDWWEEQARRTPAARPSLARRVACRLGGQCRAVAGIEALPIPVGRGGRACRGPPLSRSAPAT